MNKNLATLSRLIAALVRCSSFDEKRPETQHLNGTFLIRFEYREGHIVQAKLIESAAVLPLAVLAQTD